MIFHATILVDKIANWILGDWGPKGLLCTRLLQYSECPKSRMLGNPDFRHTKRLDLTVFLNIEKMFYV